MKTVTVAQLLVTLLQRLMLAWVLVSDVVEKTSTRRRSRIPCVVVEKITTRRREGVGVVVEKMKKVDELLTKIITIYLLQ